MSKTIPVHVLPPIKNMWLRIPNGTQDGVTFTVAADGGIHVKGTSTSSTGRTDRGSIGETPLPAGQYTLSTANLPAGIIIFVSVTTGDKTEYIVIDTSITNLTSTFTVPENSTYQCKVGAKNGGPVDATVYPMLETGSEAHAYKPYA
ncbi:hypothetical protein EMO92_08180 [Bifidobacterium reuteri]|uniref:Uncharacterized protein n=1 Tax=Bifidobacterium reuteri TaxID=983706 RepID=A0A5J5E6P4_9BIFI|nr:hypothetical protein [Bifidobacterium reuteri]KAA8824875.1 hypothetical protein EMO92_08180 [Bifidobacterium reuteri]